MLAKSWFEEFIAKSSPTMTCLSVVLVITAVALWVLVSYTHDGKADGPIEGLPASVEEFVYEGCHYLRHSSGGLIHKANCDNH